MSAQQHWPGDQERKQGIFPHMVRPSCFNGPAPAREAGEGGEGNRQPAAAGGSPLGSEAPSLAKRA